MRAAARLRDLADDFEKAVDREVAVVGDLPAAGGGELRAAEAEDVDVGRERAKLAHERAGVEIARRLAAREQSDPQERGSCEQRRIDGRVDWMSVTLAFDRQRADAPFGARTASARRSRRDSRRTSRRRAPGRRVPAAKDSLVTVKLSAVDVRTTDSDAGPENSSDALQSSVRAAHVLNQPRPR